MNHGSLRALALLTLFSVILAGCAQPAPTPTPQPATPAPTPTITPAPTSTPLPTSTPTDTPAPTRTPAVTPTAAINIACLNASFVADVTVPDNSKFDQGATLTKTWRVKNSGTCDWPADTVLVFVAGHKLNGPEALPVGAVKVGQTKDISVDMKAPNEDAVLDSVWRLQAGGKAFGAAYSVVIIVGKPPAARRITGRVVWGTTPLSGVRVELKKSLGYYNEPLLAKTVTGADGRFVFENAPASTCAVFAFAPSSEYWEYIGIEVRATSKDVEVPLSKRLQLLEPATNAKVNTTTPTLRWNSFPGAARYQVTVYEPDQGSGTMTIVFQQETTATSVAVSPSLKRGAPYTWTVRTMAENVEIAMGNAVFTVQP